MKNDLSFDIEQLHMIIFLLEKYADKKAESNYRLDIIKKDMEFDNDSLLDSLVENLSDIRRSNDDCIIEVEEICKILKELIAAIAE